MISKNRIVSYRVAAGAVGASGGDSNSAEGDGEKSGDELHGCGGGFCLVNCCE